ncbi:MAG: hypothetical protein M1814_002117 [Vezdaea aestivalis]|nr:MAG: hypothetical protein M1814_002117 [Vezdaea aestivalis]
MLSPDLNATGGMNIASLLPDRVRKTIFRELLRSRKIIYPGAPPEDIDTRIIFVNKAFLKEGLDFFFAHNRFGLRLEDVKSYKTPFNFLPGAPWSWTKEVRSLTISYHGIKDPLRDVQSVTHWAEARHVLALRILHLEFPNLPPDRPPKYVANMQSRIRAAQIETFRHGLLPQLRMSGVKTAFETQLEIFKDQLAFWRRAAKLSERRAAINLGAWNIIEQLRPRKLRMSGLRCRLIDGKITAVGGQRVMRDGRFEGYDITWPAKQPKPQTCAELDAARLLLQKRLETNEQIFNAECENVQRGWRGPVQPRVGKEAKKALGEYWCCFSRSQVSLVVLGDETNVPASFGSAVTILWAPVPVSPATMALGS